MPNFTHQQIRRVVLGILLCILLGALDQTVVIPAVPAIAADLNGYGHLAWIVSAYMLTSTAATPIYGKLSDIYGRRALLRPALALFIVASVLCALSQNLSQLIAFRALQGVGGGGLLAMAQAAIADVVVPRERGRYQAYTTTTWAVASIAGPIVGGYVTDHLSWHYVFWINLPLGIAALWLSDRALRSLPVRRHPARIDYAGAALLTATVTIWLLLLSWGGVEFPWVSVQIGLLFAAGLVLPAALVWQERRSTDPLLPPRLFDNAVFSRGVLIAFLNAVGLFATIFLLPLFFQLIRGADAEASGELVMPFLLISTFASYVGGNLSRRWGRTKILLLGGSLIGVLGFALLLLVDAQTSLWLVMLVVCIAGFGVGVVLPATLISVQNAAERRDVGVATGTLLFLRSMGGAFGSTLGGALLTLRFTAALAPLGLVGKIDLGSLRAGSDAFARLAPDARAQALGGLLSGFHLAYLACLVLLLAAVAVTFGMPDVALRGVGDPDPAPLAH